MQTKIREAPCPPVGELRLEVVALFGAVQECDATGDAIRTSAGCMIRNCYVETWLQKKECPT